MGAVAATRHFFFSVVSSILRVFYDSVNFGDGSVVLESACSSSFLLVIAEFVGLKILAFDDEVIRCGGGRSTPGVSFVFVLGGDDCRGYYFSRIFSSAVSSRGIAFPFFELLWSSSSGSRGFFLSLVAPNAAAHAPSGILIPVIMFLIWSMARSSVAGKNAGKVIMPLRATASSGKALMIPFVDSTKPNTKMQ